MGIRALLTGGVFAAAFALPALSGASPREGSFTASAALGDQASGPTDVDSFRLRARRGDRLVLSLRRDPAERTRDRASMALLLDDGSRTVLRFRTGRRSLKVRMRLPEDGRFLLSLASPEGEPFHGEYEVALLPAPGTVTGAGDPSLVPDPDVEDPVVTGPGAPAEPLPPVPPPAPVLQGYTLSGSASAPAIWHVDDALDLYVDGVLVYTDGMNGSGDRPPVRFFAHPGSVVRVVARDWYGLCANVSSLYVLRDDGPSVLVTNPIDLGCGRPYKPADGGTFFDVSVTL